MGQTKIILVKLKKGVCLETGCQVFF